MLRILFIIFIILLYCTGCTIKTSSSWFDPKHRITNSGFIGDYTSSSGNIFVKPIDAISTKVIMPHLRSSSPFQGEFFRVNSKVYFQTKGEIDGDSYCHIYYIKNKSKYYLMDKTYFVEKIVPLGKVSEKYYPATGKAAGRVTSSTVYMTNTDHLQEILLEHHNKLFPESHASKGTYQKL